MNKIAVIRIRGGIDVKIGLKDTLDMLRLYRKNYCVVMDDRPEILGMIKKVKDFVTYGEIDDDVLKLLIEKRGQKAKDDEGKESLKKFFRLSPPRKGFERKGIKIGFNAGGALGYRGKYINDLIKRMV